MSRAVRGLLWAQKAENPWPKARSPGGLKAQGIRYEAAVAARLPEARRGLWWRFCDANGTGYCQTDLLLLRDDSLFVLECKLTDTPEARKQLEHLYRPVVECALRRPVFGITVARHVTPTSSLVVDDLDTACRLALRGHLPTLLWLGRSPLVPQSRNPLGLRLVQPSAAA